MVFFKKFGQDRQDLQDFYFEKLILQTLSILSNLCVPDGSNFKLQTSNLLIPSG